MSEFNFIITVFKFVFYTIVYKKQLLLHQKWIIKGIKNIYIKELVQIGIGYVGFMHKTDKTLINVKGKLIIKGLYEIGRDCRFDIGKNAIVTIGRGGYINCNTTLVIMHELTIGDNCVISWGCQFLDENFHAITYLNKKENNHSIKIIYRT